jgi:hypothetical protein
MTLELEKKWAVVVGLVLFDEMRYKIGPQK